MASAKVFESKKEAYLLHKQSVKQQAAGSSTGQCPTVNQQAYWNHVSKYLRDHQGGRGGIKAAADSWADSRSESAAEPKAKGKAAAKATAKAKAQAKAESKSATKAKGKAKAAKHQEPNAKAEEKESKIGVTRTIQDKEKAKKQTKKADKANADTEMKAEKNVWAAFRASADK